MVLLGMSFLLTIFYLLQFANVRFVLSPKYDRFSKLLLAVLASLQIFVWQLYFYQDSHDTVALWCFALALIGGAIVWRLAIGSNATHPMLARILPIAIALVSFVEFAGFAQATKQFSDTFPAFDLANPGVLVKKTDVFVTTDCGTTIELFERSITSDEFKNCIEKSLATVLPMSEKAMLRAQPFVQSNCHGWVFSQGQHILKGTDVQLILHDNHYTQVTKPESNDVAVYRSDEGEILHTGVVRGSLEGEVIVESKWGIGALYMHIAEEQPYSQNISYYRTDRQSHSILISNSQGKVEATALDLKKGSQRHAFM
jgi:hypothetical protein